MLQFNEQARRSMKKGISTLAKAVKVTLGPRGRNVVINKGFGHPLSTKDGVTVAKEVSLKDKFENMGAQLVKEVSSKTSDMAGDGTTTAIVLAEAIFLEGMKSVSAGANPMSLKRGIEAAVKAITQALEGLAKPINSQEEIQQIATISANNDPEIGGLIAQAMAKVGKDGIISIDEAKSIETTLDVVEGMQFDKGYLSPYFVTNPENMAVELDNALVLITDQKLTTAKQIVPILEKVMAQGQRPLLIIADDIETEALATLVVNKLKNGLSLCAVKAPGFGDRRKTMLEDIAILTGGTVITNDLGLKVEEAELNMLGTAERIKVTKDDATLIDGAGDATRINERADGIRREMNTTSSEYDREKLEERLAKLVGGVAVVKVGATTETELKEKKARVEDALHATRAAVSQGVVPGGGVALLRAVRSLDRLNLEKDEATGVNIIRKAAFAPATAIANNCGKQGNLIAEKVYEAEGNTGYNGLTDEITDLLKAGVIDPVLVTKEALTNAASVVGLVLTTEAMITDIPTKASDTPPMPGMGDMSGMGGMGGMGGMPGMGGMGGMPGMGGMGGMPGMM